MPAQSQEDIPIVLTKDTDPWGMTLCYFTLEMNPKQIEGLRLKKHVSGIILEERFYRASAQHGLWPTYFRNGILSNRSTLKADGSPTGYYIGRNANDTLSSAWKED
jgi:hypothetical protein